MSLGAGGGEAGHQVDALSLVVEDDLDLRGVVSIRHLGALSITLVTYKRNALEVEELELINVVSGVDGDPAIFFKQRVHLLHEHAFCNYLLKQFPQLVSFLFLELSCNGRQLFSQD